MVAETDAVDPPSVREVGYVNPGSERSFWSLDEERVPELRWPQSLVTFDEMRRTDAQCRTVLKAITLPIRATKWRIDPAGASDEVTDFVAQQIGLPVIGQDGEVAAQRRRGRFSWSEHLEMALLAVPFGAMYFEQVVEPLPGGRWGLRKLAPRMPRTLEDIHVARDGGLIGIVQKPPMAARAARAWDASDRLIPVNRLVVYVHEKEGANWAGTSILRAAYKNWLLKEKLLKIEAVTLGRNGVGVPVYTNPPKASDDEVEKGRRMACSYQAGEGSGASIPFDSELKLLGVSGQLPDARPAIEYHDAQIGRVALAHFLNLDGQGGSYALASTQADLFTTSLAAVADMVANAANRYVVEDLVDWNFGASVPVPKIVHDDIGESPMALANALRVLVDSGVIRPDRSLEELMRRTLELPTKDTPPPGGFTPKEGE